MNAFLAGVLLLAFTAQGMQLRKTTCHDTPFPKGSKCEVVVVPPQLCNACNLKDVNLDGTFKDCSSIFNTSSAQCKFQLQKYVSLNPCDTYVKRLVQSYKKNIENLDDFIYGVCEGCCDCVSIGAKVNEYWKRKTKNTLFDYKTRANCGLHPAIDLCNVLPKIKTFVSSSDDVPTKTELAKMPYVCPSFRAWREKRIKNPATATESVPKFAHGFLQNLLKVFRCGQRTTWQRCTVMESRQERI